LYDGVAFDPGTFDRPQARALERLKARQFVDVGATSGFRLVKTRAPFSSLAIDWDALARRRSAELAKLDQMEGYALTRDCRRRFVLAYFGESDGRRNCGGCDNCLGR
jgi:ATP-dependent DNA helicase RecQ